MYVLSHSIPVNPQGIEPVLSQEQIWRGLEMKAENAVPFVKDMTQCDLLERVGNIIYRELTFRGAQHRERVTLYAPVQVTFERQDGTGWINNTLSDSEFGLLLTFTFGLTFPGIEENSPAEREHGDSVRGAYVGAVAATLARVRQMVLGGEL